MDKIHWISIQMYYIVAILVLKSCDNVSFKLMMMIETRPRGLWCQFERCCLTGCLTGAAAAGVTLVVSTSQVCLSHLSFLCRLPPLPCPPEHYHPLEPPKEKDMTRQPFSVIPQHRFICLLCLVVCHNFIILSVQVHEYFTLLLFLGKPFHCGPHQGFRQLLLQVP